MTRFIPPRPSLKTGVVACAGIFIAIAALAYISFDLKILLVLGSFGSTTMLLYCFPDNYFSQPRSIIGGHFVSSVVGLTALSAFGQQWWALGLAVALAAGLMMVTRTMHPPAGSNPIIVFLSLPHWDFLIFPTLFGAVTLVLGGLVFHRACQRVYPLYWRGFNDPAQGSAVKDATVAWPPVEQSRKNKKAA
jgi:CBS-domain-containing membrane protein